MSLVSSKRFPLRLTLLIEFILLALISYSAAVILAQWLGPFISDYPACSGRREGVPLASIGVCSGTFLIGSLPTFIFSFGFVVTNTKLLKGKFANSAKFLKLSVAVGLLVIIIVNTLLVIQANLFVGFVYLVLAGVILPFILKEIGKALK